MTQRSPIAVFFLPGITFGIYGLYWFIKTSDEMRNLGADIPAWIHLFIPILNLLWLWKYAQGVEKITNGEMGAGMAFILFMTPFGMAMCQSKYNAVGGGAPA